MRGRAVPRGAAHRPPGRAGGDGEVAHVAGHEDGRPAVRPTDLAARRGPHEVAVRAGRDAHLRADGGQERFTVVLGTEADGSAEPGDEAVQLGDVAEPGEEVGAPRDRGPQPRSELEPDAGDRGLRKRLVEGHPDGLTDDRRADPDAIHRDPQATHGTELGGCRVELQPVDGAAAGVVQRDGRVDVHPACVPIEVHGDVVAGLQSVAGHGRLCPTSGRHRERGHQEQRRPARPGARPPRRSGVAGARAAHGVVGAGVDGRARHHGSGTARKPSRVARQPRVGQCPGAFRGATECLSVPRSVSARMTLRATETMM